MLSETIQNDSKDLTFKIDKTKQTASLFKVKADTKHLIIPRSIKHGPIDYLITSITCIDFYVKTVKFLDDSAVKTIYRGAFSGIHLEELYFPASLKELKEGWCYDTKNLTKITVSPLNDQFIFKEDKLLFGKSDKNNDEFDVLLFSSRDIEKVNIPFNIKIISSCAFEHCKNLRKVEIPMNSNLETIESHAFSYSNIEKILIPPKVKKICKFAFGDCQNLTKVEIPMNSNLEIIESRAFAYSNIEKIFIPPKVTKISESTFENCQNLTKVEIPPNSNLQLICYEAFSGSSIEELYFPASLKELKEGWCYDTKNLTKITVSPLNDQFIFKEDKLLFGKSDKNNDEFDVLLFSSRDIEKVNIPFNIKIISSCAFEHCKNLRKVEIPMNSNLETIESHAFSYSNIGKILIPPKVTRICDSVFFYCENLRKVEIPKNSNLEIIELGAFISTKIKKNFLSHQKLQEYMNPRSSIVKI